MEILVLRFFDNTILFKEKTESSQLLSAANVKRMVETNVQTSQRVNIWVEIVCRNRAHVLGWDSPLRLINLCNLNILHREGWDFTQRGTLSIRYQFRNYFRNDCLRATTKIPTWPRLLFVLKIRTSWNIPVHFVVEMMFPNTF